MQMCRVHIASSVFTTFHKVTSMRKFVDQFWFPHRGSFVNGGALQTRPMSDHRMMPISPTRWQWHKTKDLIHLYAMVGGIPCTIGVLLTQIFIGPAELQAIPEGYEPKHWEYYRDPISRFIARYIYTPPQMEYEKYLHVLWTESQIIQIRQLEKRVDELMFKRKDYQAYYYQPYNANYARKIHEGEHKRHEIRKGEF